MSSPITTHVLDTAKGCPAAGIPVTLECSTGSGAWKVLGTGTTNADGRIVDLIGQEGFRAGVYRISFDTADYLGELSFFPHVSVAFRVHQADQHYHVPILLSPFGFSTYRGS